MEKKSDVDKKTGGIQWETGTWERPRGGNPSAQIVIAGDWAPIRDFSDLILENPEQVYGDLLPVLRDGDLRIANLECPLVDEGSPVWKSGAVLKGLSGHVAGLTCVPFEIVTLGNNHILDYGVEAFRQTRRLLRKEGIQFTGAGLSLAEAQQPVRVSANGVTLGVVSFGEGEDLTAAAPGKPGVLGWEVDRIAGLVKRLRSEVHVLVVICHAGVEYIPFPPPYVADALRCIAEAGADLIIGHHPHVPQGIQIHEGVPICYSLGNFVFFQPTDLLYRKIGYLVNAGVAKDGVVTLQILPYEIGPESLLRLTGGTLQKAFRKLETLSERLDRPERLLEAWNGFLKHYGAAGFKKEMAGILEQFEQEPPKGAAMFRNRLTTLQHCRHLTDLMTRIMEGTLDKAPAWAVTLVEEFFSRKVEEGLPG